MLLFGFDRRDCAFIVSKYHEPVNIGNPVEFTILEFARLVTRLANTKSKIVFKPLPVDDPKQRRPDIGLAKRLLKWTPKVPLEVGLKETIKWFENSS